MSKGYRLPRVILGCVVACASLAAAQNSQGGLLDQEFQSAVSQYHAGNFAAAAAQLEKLVSVAPKSFEVHELLGLVYAAQSKNRQSIDQLQVAVRLKPDSAAARTNLATTLLRAGQSALAEEQFHKALSLEPNDFQANHNLAEFYLQSGKIMEALPLLEKAQQINPSSFDNGYNLALAYFLTGKSNQSRELVQKLVQQKDTGELHNLLGKINEKDGKFIEAANEFETAARMDPSEDNLFVWGSELLLHRTYEPAIQVFQKGTERFPTSPRLWIGLGMAFYSRGRYEESIKALLQAADLNPTDARCYLFLSKAYLSSPNQADEVIQRFRRYAELDPRNALAQYYYAVSLWKGKRSEASSINYLLIESLLQKAISLDGTLADAHLQLGILYADQHEYAKSFPEYTRALELNPGLADAHYRLGQYYVHAGQKDRAQQEFQTFQQLQAHHQAEIDKERAEVRQFVYSSNSASASKP
ncbi:MAG: tetratricopeptide repeat protein [Candidatus Sulfotelmatobacter sp.]